MYLIETKLFYSNIILILTLALQLSVSGYERICTCRRKYFRLFLCSEYLHLQIVKPSQQKQKTSKQINKQANNKQANNKQTSKQINKQTSKQINKQTTNKQTSKQANKQTSKQQANKQKCVYLM